MLKVPQVGTLDLLIQAAEFLENKDKCDRETEHGYATPAYRIGQNYRTKIKTVRRSQNRTSHNELEKNRRAHLRNCLDGLKAIVPLNQDSTRALYIYPWENFGKKVKTVLRYTRFTSVVNGLL
uniref:BHLH domain-containing protein n=1 Tax=Ciona savignyi TaxID=51511 RepID=H2Y6W2_CIOSA